jgi:hypothetical protein
MSGYQTGRSLSNSARRHYEVTPSADALDPKPTALWVNGGGDLVMEDGAGTVVTWEVPAGVMLPFQPVKILSGTTAQIVAVHG